MNIQIIGTKKCSETRKAERWFKERRISFHFRDLTEKGVSKGELENISRKIPMDQLLDKNGREYEKRGLAYMTFNLEEELLEHPLLLKTPIVRNGSDATVGYEPDVWKNWK